MMPPPVTSGSGMGRAQTLKTFVPAGARHARE
jgi:hypothetical protein